MDAHREILCTLAAVAAIPEEEIRHYHKLRTDLDFDSLDEIDLVFRLKWIFFPEMPNADDLLLTHFKQIGEVSVDDVCREVNSLLAQFPETPARAAARRKEQADIHTG